MVIPQFLNPSDIVALWATIPFVLGLLGGGLSLLKRRFKLAFIGSIASVVGWSYILIGWVQHSWGFFLGRDLLQTIGTYGFLVLFGALVVVSIVTAISVYQSKSIFYR